MEKDDDLDKPLMRRCIATVLISAILVLGARAQRNYNDCTPPCYEWVESGSGGSGHCEPVFEVKRELLQCPTLEMESPGPPTCVCSPTGTASAVVAAPPFHVSEVGKCKTYYDPAECGEEEINDFGFEEYVWTWTVGGVQATPNAGSGQTAEFDYEVPEGSFNITVNFQLVGKPEKPDGCVCEDATVSGSGAPINGRGYASVPFDPATCSGPNPLACAIDAHGGLSYPPFPTASLNCVQVCQCPNEKWQLTGKYSSDLIINVYTSILIQASGCSTGPPGSCADRLSTFIAASIQHEQIHCADMSAVLDHFNALIAAMPLHDSESECREAGIALNLQMLRTWLITARDSNNHATPGFAGTPRLGADACGREFTWGSYP